LLEVRSNIGEKNIIMKVKNFSYFNKYKKSEILNNEARAKLTLSRLVFEVMILLFFLGLVTCDACTFSHFQPFVPISDLIVPISDLILVEVPSFRNCRI
jgi:hypothetical protein